MIQKEPEVPVTGLQGFRRLHGDKIKPVRGCVEILHIGTNDIRESETPCDRREAATER
jgi:hypothetical protein